MRGGIRAYVGYDAREHAAWLVCRDSLVRETPELEVVPLHHRALRQAGLFTRAWETAPNGQTYDAGDGRPFSTEFSHSRFLTPALARRDGGCRWALFVDCDFLFLSGIDSMLDGVPEDERGRPVYVVRHAPDTAMAGATKMDGMLQQAYPRKLWSSLMLWDLWHPATAELTPDMVNTLPGSGLHGFSWLGDDQIGGLELSWNWVPGRSDPDVIPDAVHFSLGGPWMSGYEGVRYGDIWRGRYRQAVRERLESGREHELWGLGA